MKKVFYLLMTCCLFSLSSFSATTVTANALPADEYTVNDQQIEQLFSNSLDVSLTSVSESLLTNPSAKSASNKAFYAPSDKNFATALLLNFFLGGLGIHRLYLGTKTFTWIGYILTCGGIFGVVPLIDLIVLIVHNADISPYVDNPKFFMWSGGSM